MRTLLLAGLMSLVTPVQIWSASLGIHIDPFSPKDEITAEYQNAWEADLLLSGEQVDLLREHRVLLIGGFLSDNVVSWSDVLPGYAIEFRSYFDDQLNWFENIGVEVERLKIQSEASPEENARIIATAVDTSDKPVVLIGHSKGGLDALEMLRLYPGLRPKVRGWISVQTPFFGSPLADAIIDHGASGWAASLLLRIMGGNRDSLVSLTQKRRWEYFHKYSGEIKTLVGEVPLICISTWIADEPWKLDTTLEPLRDWMAWRGMRNDGAVPWASAILPNTPYIVLKKLDHLITMMRNPPLQFDRERFTKALTILLLRRMSHHPKFRLD